MTAQQFITATMVVCEGMSANAGPFKMVELYDNPIDGISYTCLIIVYEGIVDDAVTKNIYRFWLNAQSVVRKARVPKSEWPVGV